MRRSLSLLPLGASAALALLSPGPAAAQDVAGGPCACVDEGAVRRARNGLGLSAGSWRARAEAPAGVARSDAPTFEGYVARGLDRHLVLESSIGYWRRTERTPATATAQARTVSTHVVPQLNALRAFPFTRPEHRVEPWLRGGVGPAAAIEEGTAVDDEPGVPAGGGALGEDVRFRLGLVAAAGGGVDLRVTRALGVTAGASYRYLRLFGEALGGPRVVEGVTLEAGLSYRYQFR